MEPYLIIVVGAIVSALAYGIYDLSNVHFTGEFSIPQINVTTTSTTNVFTATGTETQTTAGTATTSSTNNSETTTASISNPTPKVSFNEIMYDPSGSDEDKEWVEIYSDSNVNISGWKFFESNTNHKISAKGLSVFAGYAVIANNASKFLELYPSFSGVLFESPFSLGNSGEHLELRDSGLKTINAIDYSSSLGANGNGKSLEYRDIGWGESSVDGGTPGSKNSQPSQTTTSATQSSTTSAATQSSTSTTTTSATSTIQSTSTSTTTQTTSTTTAMALQLAVTTSNSTLVRGHDIIVTTYVSNSVPVENALVNVTIGYASGKIYTCGSGNTNSSGYFTCTKTIGGSSSCGIYNATATAVKDNQQAMGYTTFQVVNASSPC